MEHKTVPFEISAVDVEGRRFEGHAAVFGNVDLGGDVIHPGAFSKTLAERGQKVKLLWQHDPHEPIGRPLTMREDSKGLFFEGLISNTQRGRDALALLHDHAIGEMSIGYDPLDKDFSETVDPDGKSQTVRNLRTIKLWEVSLVTFPMNEEAEVTALKAQEAAEAAAESAASEVKAVNQALIDLFVALQAEGFELLPLLNGVIPDADTGAAAADDAGTADAQGQAAPEDEPDGSASDSAQAGPDAETPDGATDDPPTSDEQERLRQMAEAIRIRTELVEVEHADL
jgi:HK97 family phage prohead protease